jgi:hypothetical protein
MEIVRAFGAPLMSGLNGTMRTKYIKTGKGSMAGKYRVMKMAGKEKRLAVKDTA